MKEDRELEQIQYEIATATGNIPPITETDFEIRVPVIVTGLKMAEILRARHSDSELNRMTDEALSASVAEYFHDLSQQPVKVDQAAAYARVQQFVQARAGLTGPPPSALDNVPSEDSLVGWAGGVQ